MKTGDVVGLVEIMKSFYWVVSDADGRLVRFLVENDASWTWARASPCWS